MMYDYCEYGINFTECIIFIWVLAVFIDEIRQIWMTPGINESRILKKINFSETSYESRGWYLDNADWIYEKSQALLYNIYLGSYG